MEQTPKGLDASSEFMLLLGVCITEWAEIEDDVFEIFHSVLAADHRRTAILFYSIPTLSSRLDTCSELLTTVIPDKGSKGRKHEDRETWRKLVDQIKKAMQIRNRLAHSPVLPYIPGAKDWLEYFKSGERIRLRLYTPLPKMNRAKHEKEQPIELEDLKAHLAEVQRLISEVRRFRSVVLLKHTVKFPAPSQLSPD